MKSLKEQILLLKEKKLSSQELIQEQLKQIKQQQHLNAFITYDADYALQQAKRADQLLQKNQGSVLTGIPIAHKDNFCTHHFRTTCGSKMLADFQSPYQATVVERLSLAGAITLGKTNMDEFAMGSANENSFFGPVKNPWDTACVPGGSSGGSAAAVAAQLVAFATGTDTGGSVRQPAAFCGISGLKPTYGLVSRYGMVAFGSSLDQAGIFAHSAEDLAIVLQVIAGFDAKDSTSVNRAVPDYSASLHKPFKPLRIGVPRYLSNLQVDNAIQQIMRDAIAVFEQAGAQIIDIDFSYQAYWAPCYYVVACAEAASNLSRFDGIRYGYRSKNANNVRELITSSRSEAFGNEVKRRILTGTYVLSSGFYDAYYLQALKVRQLIKQEFQAAFTQVDAIMGPTTPTAAYKIGEKKIDPTQRYLGDIFTVPANLAGLPALSIPVGFCGSLPVGMQLIGNHFAESTLLHCAHLFQQKTDWHQRIPPMEKQ